MNMFADWREYYNNLDAEPFLEALEAMQGFYTGLGINVDAEAVSLAEFS